MCVCVCFFYLTCSSDDCMYALGFACYFSATNNSTMTKYIAFKCVMMWSQLFAPAESPQSDLVFSPFSHLRTRELSGPSKARRYYQRPKASEDQNPGFPFRSPPLAKELVTAGRHNVFFFLTDLCIYLYLTSQKCWSGCKLRYQDLYFLSPHSLLLGGSPDGLIYHSQARTE